MFTTDVIYKLESDLWIDIRAFVPELLLCVGIVMMLGLRLLPRLRLHMGGVAMFFSSVALLLSVGQWLAMEQITDKLNIIGDLLNRPAVNFAGMISLDMFTAFMRMVLLGFAVLLIALSMISGIPDEEDSADFYTLLLGGILGMMLMASATHLLMIFIAIEMASLPSYALAGFLKGRRLGSEASLKYVVYGGGASGVMLYGISLVSGRFGTGYLPDVMAALRQQFQTGTMTLSGVDTIVLLGLVFIFVGLAFKLSVVPFHFWAPDVFEGAAAEVGAFLSVASKAAALALTARLLMMLSAEEAHRPIENIQRTIGPPIAFFACLTATFGNLAAFPQNNLKRLLAYSTIAHAGYMLMGLSALNVAGTQAVLYYLVAYLVMNLGAFATVAFIRNATGSEDLRDLRGLVYRSPLAVSLLSLFLLSLLGLPPLCGFAAKFGIFQVLYNAGKDFTAGAHESNYSLTMGYTMYATLLIGGVNTVISAVYYLKVMKVMILERPVEEVEGQPAPRLRLSFVNGLYGSLLGLAIFGVFAAWGKISRATEIAVDDFTPNQKQTIAPPSPGGGGNRPQGPAGGPAGRPGGGGAGRPGGAGAGGAGRPQGGRPGGGP